MTDPTISCPSCKTTIKLTESLAAPLLEATRREYQQKITQKDQDIAARESAVRDQLDTVRKERASIDDTVNEKLKNARVTIAAEEAKKAKLALAADLEQKTRDLADLNDVIKQKDQKLAEAQKAQAEVLRKQRELDDAKRELDLTVEKRVQEGVLANREQVTKEVEDQYKLKVFEKEQTISGMQRQIEELKRKAEQGSQQLQGEVQELELEALLKSRFPLDSIVPVPKGEFGGDVIQKVVGPLAQDCGAILWESKRTKNWSDTWLSKLREDQRTLKAEVSILVTTALPKGIETFDYLEGIWVTHPRTALPVAMALRQSILEVSGARKASEGQQTKMEMVYQYLTGPRFRQRVQAMVEAFSSMKDDLNSEKKAILKQWAKREEQIDRVMQATVGMYGDLQGIAGKTLQEIDGISLETLEYANSDVHE